MSKYGQSLIRSDQLPDLAVQYGAQPGIQLAATHRAPDHPLLEGDLFALGLINLDSVGLGFYKNTLGSAHQQAPTASQQISAAYSQPIIQSAISHVISESLPVPNAYSNISPIQSTFNQATSGDAYTSFTHATPIQSTIASAVLGGTQMATTGHSAAVETTTAAANKSSANNNESSVITETYQVEETTEEVTEEVITQ